jgi:hypothetical protein
MRTPVEARFEIERQLCEMAEANGGSMPLIADLRFIPTGDCRVLACAELVDGGEMQVLCELPVPIKGRFDEDAFRDRWFLAAPSGAKH